MGLQIENQNEVAVHAVRHLPIIREYAAKTGLVETINQLIPSQMDVEPGIIFLGLILDTLSGRTPLYRLDEFFEQQDTELLLGKEITPDKFADHNVDRVLDKAYEIGTIKIFSEVARKAVSIFNIETRHVSFDTTSVSVYGDYELYSNESEGVPFKITHGHSKAHRPDLKQFLVSMLCADRNIPIFGRTLDGNGSDKTINNEVLSSISSHMAKYGLKEGAFVYIGDSALVTEANLKAIGDEILFISRLPATYIECGRVITEAVEKNEWEDLGVLAKTESTEKRPSATYKAFESDVVLYGKTYRAVVIHSSSHDKRRQKRIERELETERNALNSRNKAIDKREFFCRADAQKAVDELRSTKSKYYRSDAEVKESPKYKRGRPKGGVREVQEIRYGIAAQVKENTEAVERLRKEAGCFVLISNVPKEGEGCYDSHAILKAYKDQYGIEQNFGFLKDPAIVNGIFLKKAERIEVLGLVLLLSLLIWRLIEHTMRRYVDKTGEDLPGWNKRRTERPTSFMLVTKFAWVMIIKIGEKRKLNRPLSSQQKEYLIALGIREEIFIKPGCG